MRVCPIYMCVCIYIMNAVIVICLSHPYHNKLSTPANKGHESCHIYFVYFAIGMRIRSPTCFVFLSICLRCSNQRCVFQATSQCVENMYRIYPIVLFSKNKKLRLSFIKYVYKSVDTRSAQKDEKVLRQKYREDYYIQFHRMCSASSK